MEYGANVVDNCLMPNCDPNGALISYGIIMSRQWANGTVYDQMDPRGSSVSVDLGSVA